MVAERGYFSDMQEMPDEEGRGEFESKEVELEEDELSGIADEDETPEMSGDFDSNIAESLSESQLLGIGQSLKNLLDSDVESRSNWERRMISGMEIIGSEDIPEDAAAFDGASRVTHPGLAEAIVQFQARAMEELLPPSGPVKSTKLGNAGGEKLDEQANRVEDALNYQLTEGDDQYYWDTDAMLFYLPYAGSAFKKVAVDPVSGMTRSRFVRGTDLIVPYSATSLSDAPRYTHRYTISRNDYLRAVDRGYFIDSNLPLHSSTSQASIDGRELQDRADDRSASFSTEDEDYVFCETHVEIELPVKDPFGGGKKFKLPYVITWESETQKVVRISRLWLEEDDQYKKVVWFVHEKFLPGLGFYGFGYLHLIGSLGKAASGALRAVLDGSMTASLQGGFKSREARAVSGEITFQPGVWQDVDMAAEDLAKSFYTPPFRDPSPALFQTLNLLVEGISRFASTTEAMVGDASNTGPVGTTVALIEQGSKVYSGIHRRLHLAARQEFKLICLCNYLYMSADDYEYRAGGEMRKVSREDFDTKVDILPVSDPNIFSSTQRIAQAQAVVQDVDANPDIYSKKAKEKAHRFLLKALRIPETDEYLPENSASKRVDPITENQRAMTGAPSKAYPEQDHASHLTLHGNFIAELMGMNDPEITNKVVPLLKAHVAEHLAWAYRHRIGAELMAKTGIPLPPIDSDMESEELPIEVENAVAQAVAQFIEPPPPPQAPPQVDDPARKADREDMLAQRKVQREDLAHAAKLKREGLIDDNQFAAMTRGVQQPVDSGPPQQ